MTIPATTLFRQILSLCALIGLLAACTPPPTVPPTSNLTLDMRRMQTTMDRQEQAIQDLSSKLTELDNRLQLQAGQMEELRRAQQQP